MSKIKLTNTRLSNVIRRCVNEAIDGDITNYAYTDDPTDYTFDEYNDLDMKLSHNNPNKGTLDKLIKSNPKYKKWYNNLRKNAENKVSWEAFDNKKNSDLENQKMGDLMNYSNPNIVDDNYTLVFDDYGNAENERNKQNESKHINTTKKRIRLTESQLHNVISRSVKSILREGAKPNANPKAAWEDVDDRSQGAVRDEKDFMYDDYQDADYYADSTVRDLVDDIVDRYNISTRRALNMVIGRLNYWLKNID